ncbi:MAG: TolB family protein [Planctomycetota bacterium]|jgi:Tol biopolymer transport system component
MKKRFGYILVLAVVAALLVCALYYAVDAQRVVITEYESVGRPPKIRPDYTQTIIPWNIAPLNFRVQQDGSRYFVKIYSKQGKPIEVVSRSQKIVIPRRSWHRLLSKNKGQELYFEVSVKTEDGRWTRFSPITNKIAHENIDSFLVYRKMFSLYSRWKEMGIYQRNLETCDESVVLHNRFFNGGCVNCHTFLNNKTEKMLMHVRDKGRPSMLLIEDGQASSMNSRTQFGSAPMGHTTWHPSGKMIVFTIYRVRQFFHTIRKEVRDVVDLDSSMGYYVFDSEALKTNAGFSRKDYLETFPTWSPDGHYLYFCSAPILWQDRHEVPPERYQESKYDLMRISYDIESDTWGQLETVLSAKETGLSIVQPRISPDGKFLLFCMCKYSGFPAFQPNSDLYLMDLTTGRYEPLECNSEQSESWHCWSSNGRWIAFSSKRPDGMFSKVYFSYVDENGKVHKPFILAQKDAAFYDSFAKLYQMPELVRSPVPLRGESLAYLIRSRGRVLSQLAVTSATPDADSSSPWQRGIE